MDASRKTIDLIKTNAVNSKCFDELCKNVGAGHVQSSITVRRDGSQETAVHFVATNSNIVVQGLNNNTFVVDPGKEERDVSTAPTVDSIFLSIKNSLTEQK